MNGTDSHCSCSATRRTQRAHQHVHRIHKERANQPGMVSDLYCLIQQVALCSLPLNTGLGISAQVLHHLVSLLLQGQV